MNISAVSIRRPIATTLLMAALMIAGVIGYNLLPVASLPTVDFPTIAVTANLPGSGNHGGLLYLLFTLAVPCGPWGVLILFAA